MRQELFDIIGDVHGCADELKALLGELGYVTGAGGGWRPPAGRTAVFVGDLVDRGPRNVESLQIAVAMVGQGNALWTPGNHDVKLERYLAGDDAPLLYGLAETVEELERESKAFRRSVFECLVRLPGHLVLDEGRLVVAHTGLEERLHGLETPETRQLAAFGVPAGEAEPGDASLRHLWVSSYAGKAVVVYGHTSVREIVWRGNTVDIDTGCVFGGSLSALRWPERQVVSVRARHAYAPPPRHYSPPPAHSPR